MYQVGDSVPLSFRVINQQKTLVDSFVTLTVTGPDDVDVDVDTSRISVGLYSALFVPTLPGRHIAAWSSAGNFAKSQTDIINVYDVEAPAELISLAEAKEHLNMDSEPSEEDEELRGFIAAASRVVEQYTKQVIARRTVVEDHALDGSGTVVLNAAPVIALTSVASPDGSDPVDVDTVTVDLPNGIVSLFGVGSKRFTFVAGYTQVPENVVKATQIICGHLWQTQRVQQVGLSSGFGGEVTAQVSGRGYLIPNQAAQLLGGRAPNRP